MKKFLVLALLPIVAITFIACKSNDLKNSKMEEKETVQSNENIQNKDSESKKEIKSQKQNGDNNEVLKEYTILKLEEDTKIPYKKGVYPEVDQAFKLYEDYLINGADKISDRMVSEDLDENSVPTLKKPSEKIIKDLYLTRESILNQVQGKIVSISAEDFEYAKGLKCDDAKFESMDIHTSGIMKTDSGEEYRKSMYISIYKDKGVIKYQIR